MTITAKRGSYRRLLGQDEKTVEKRVQYFALAAVGSLYFTDAVELYLPSVITHPVSCDLGLSKEQEQILALALYISLAAFIILTVPISNRFGRRFVILVAIYLSILTTVVCSVVPNFATLLLSRILVGVTVAINISTATVYLAEISTDEWFAVVGLSLSLVMYTIGMGWGGILGYLVLDTIGWRYLVLLATTPFYILPLILVHFFLPESKRPVPKETKDCEKLESVKDVDSKEKHDISKVTESETSLKTALIHATKVCVNSFTYSAVQNSAVLLIPALYMEKNLSENVTQVALENNPCGEIHGTQFLTLFIVFSCGSIMGRVINYLLHKRLCTGLIFLLNATIALGCLIVIKFYRFNYTIIFVCLAIIQTVLSSSSQESVLVSNNVQNLSSKYIALVSGLFNATFYFSFIATSAVAVFFPIDTVIYIKIGLSIASMLSAFWMALTK